MGRIRYQSEVSALSGRSNSPLQRANTDPDVYGANIGRATQEIGQAIGDVGDVAFDISIKQRDKERREREANSVATFDWTDEELALRNEIGPDAEGYNDKVREGYMSAVEKHIDGIEDDVVRTNVRETLLRNLPSVSSRSSQYEFTTRAEMSKNRSNEALNSLQNKINQDPTQYDMYRDQGNDVIDALPNVTASFKEGMKTTWKYDSAKRRFDGMVNNVKTIDDIDNIAAELAGGEDMRDWQSEMLPTDYESLMNSLGTMRKSFNTKNNTDARAVLSSLEERINTNPVLIPSEELTQMQEVVARTTDTAIRARAGRIMRNQEIIRQEQRLSPAELRARINAADGNPGLTYPGLPVEVSDAVNSASEQFGVSASLLGAMANREYGSEFAKANKASDALKQYVPTAAHGDVDVRNIRSDVLDAVTLAGSAIGQPITLTQGRRVMDTNSIFVSTVGMDADQKSKVVASLVDAGFTGFSEEDSYIEVGMLPAVPASFKDKKGQVWGGWTYLSPEVAEVLKGKGFKAGADSAAIDRKKLTSPATGVDYGKPTSILGPDGKPTSSAVGLFQFTKETWLRTIKDPTVMAVSGIDPKLSDEELLKLRADPKLSTFAAAAYAKKNQKALETTLGRSVNDAEVYMAHFLGAGGASTFLVAHKNNPDQIAADLMPEAAKANKPVFYRDGKALTVAQVYNDISQGFTLQPSHVAYEDNKTRKAMLKQTEAMLKSDPMQHAMNVGSHTVTPLSEPSGFSSRGAQARSVADYYTIPMDEVKPFTTDEAAALKKTISEGSVDDNLALMANIQSMGSETAKAALKQLDAEDSVFAHSADLFLGGNTTVAGDIVRGRKRMDENPAIIEQIGRTKNELNDDFTSLTGGALFDLKPERRQTVADAATALYIQRMTTHGGNIGRFDKDTYEQAVQDVMGAQPGMPAIADVNGNATFIPRGLTADDVESALYKMTIDDWTRMSDTGDAPRYPDGTIVDVEDIRDEVMLRSIGNNKYKVMLDDGGFLTTGSVNEYGRWKYYIMNIDPEYMKKISVRPSTVSQYRYRSYFLD